MNSGFYSSRHFSIERYAMQHVETKMEYLDFDSIQPGVEKGKVKSGYNKTAHIFVAI